MTICAIPGCTAHLGCQLRAKNIGLGKGALETRTRRVGRPDRPVYNQWEAGFAGEARPDGTFMPYLSNESGMPMRLKEASENHHEIEARVKRLQTDPHVFADPATTTT